MKTNRVAGNDQDRANYVTASDQLKGARIHITGVVQGVGFRPFIYSLAQRLRLAGWVRNTSAGVEIEVDGNPANLNEFILSIERDAPPLARIDSIKTDLMPPNGYTTFEIIHSTAIEQAFQPISPDVSICPDCLHELFDPSDRRYLYPFINCTNCGPRFTIITDIPYDRPNTTMVGFPMCHPCTSEYSDPSNRRFHAQPIACPTCGPFIWLESTKQILPALIEAEEKPSPGTSSREVVGEAQLLLSEGKILAIKGLGGLHLACDATNHQAVIELRQRKLRVDKPFALMMPDIATIREHCYLNDAEQKLLESHQRPIVILKRRPDSTISPDVAPQQDTMGVMLPYTPLHFLLFANLVSWEKSRPSLTGVPPQILVMTSGNLSEEPIAIDNAEARQRLSSLADALLLHDRPIRTRCDDSVVRNFRGDNYPIRRSRGYAPLPLTLLWETPPLLATGAELKNTFCLARSQYAFLSQHIGDMENYETLLSFEDGIGHMERLFKIHPEVLAYDLHPNYLATRYAVARAREQDLPALGIQHHHAHIAACMVDNHLPLEATVLGVSFDGTGYGDDGAIWGGEFLLANYYGYKRLAHLEYAPLPGGDAAIRKPARTALAQLWQAGLDWEPGLPPVGAFCAEEKAALHSQLEHKVNTPLTSSIGRLFDAAAALAGVRQALNYEAQAAIEFEALVDPQERSAYPFELKHSPPLESDPAIKISPAVMFSAMIQDIHSAIPLPHIAARFHNGVAEMVYNTLVAIRNSMGVSLVALSGGVWQNLTLLHKTIDLLESGGFTVLIHHQIPTNDGGLALGQVAISSANLLQRSKLSPS